MAKKRHSKRPSPKELSYSVREFGNVMLGKLMRNNHKPCWRQESHSYLLARLLEEVAELAEAMESGSALEIVKEAADCSNTCLMIADISKRIERLQRGRMHTEGDDIHDG